MRTWSPWLVVVTMIGCASPPPQPMDPVCLGQGLDTPKPTACMWEVPTEATVRFCTPSAYADRLEILQGGLESCTIGVGHEWQTIRVRDPGVLIEFEIEGELPGATVEAYCTSSDGKPGLTWHAPVCFEEKSSQVGAPILMDE